MYRWIGPHLVFAAVACGDAASRAPSSIEVSLLDPQAWVVTADTADPMAAHRPSEFHCDVPAHYAEGDTIEVRTRSCNYVSISSELEHPIEAGDHLRVSTWWQRLASESPARGHLAFLLDDDIIWETWVDIPGAADAREAHVVFERAYAEGTPMIFHVHNHGYNTWTLGELTLTKETTR